MPNNEGNYDKFISGLSGEEAEVIDREKKTKAFLDEANKNTGFNRIDHHGKHRKG